MKVTNLHIQPAFGISRINSRKKFASPTLIPFQQNEWDTGIATLITYGKKSVRQSPETTQCANSLFCTWHCLYGYKLPGMLTLNVAFYFKHYPGLQKTVLTQIIIKSYRPNKDRKITYFNFDEEGYLLENGKQKSKKLNKYPTLQFLFKEIQKLNIKSTLKSK